MFLSICLVLLARIILITVINVRYALMIGELCKFIMILLQGYRSCDQFRSH
jgi:hypothetical protein